MLTTEQISDLWLTHLVTAQHSLVTFVRFGVLDYFRPLRLTGSASWRYTRNPATVRSGRAL